MSHPPQTAVGRTLSLLGGLLIAVAASTAANADELDDLFGPLTFETADPFPPPATAPEAQVAQLYGEVTEVPNYANASQSPPAAQRRLTADTEPAPSASRMPSAATLRQARALAASQQRRARLEAARWSGQPILRPTWSGTWRPLPRVAQRGSGLANLHRRWLDSLS